MRWSAEAKEFVWANAHTYSDEALASLLGARLGRPVSRDAVRKCRQRLRVRKGAGRGRCEVVSRPLRPGGVGLVVQGHAQGPGQGGVRVRGGTQEAED
jgi:hypothetical protein